MIDYEVITKTKVYTGEEWVQIYQVLDHEVHCRICWGVFPRAMLMESDLTLHTNWHSHHG